LSAQDGGEADGTSEEKKQRRNNSNRKSVRLDVGAQMEETKDEEANTINDSFAEGKEADFRAIPTL
jgi:hypothetical protein